MSPTYFFPSFRIQLKAKNRNKVETEPESRCSLKGKRVGDQIFVSMEDLGRWWKVREKGKASMED